MQRYFMTADAHKIGQTFALDSEAAHHVTRVMRMVVGDKIEVVFNEQFAFQAKIKSIDGKQVTVQLEKSLISQSELPCTVTIVCGVSKKDKAEWIVQKGTEMGASQFVFFMSQYGVAKWDEKKQPKKQERLAKIALEAARQSHRLSVPKVVILPNLKAVTQLTKDTGIVAYEEAAKQGETAQLVKQVRQMQTGQRLVAVFGPEGGLAPAEVALLENAAFVPVGLGPRILRAETAPLYLLAALSVIWELQ
ncbi:16S rRNA (uracil(1498)-N(3))-methyltransferase [Loigolactobacillus iwatensis]|uniref:16S rRNA (uracil(1498)-N(3))-methyltransferase n=1 Tax=Loigolactobacillus iwatensis TaxID=1267156 RepID=UPI000F7E9B0B|nr:16S rRNA (uracil(1498)-N(3))-methyltransferase [Loigolactobacillus iwatensis]